MDEKNINISKFIDANGQIIALPSKNSIRVAVIEYLAQKFANKRDYTEKEVNAICDSWHTFNDYFVLRRELVDLGFLMRKPDGSRYWRIK